MSDKKSAKKKDKKDKKDSKDKKDKKDKKPTTKEASKKKDSAKKDSAKKGSKSSSTPKSSKESTSTSAVKDSKKSKDAKKPKDSKDSKKSKDSKDSNGKKSKQKDSKKSKDSKDKSSKKKDSKKKKSKKPSIQLAQVRELLDDSGSASSEHRVLVDRLWPRGVKKERLAHDEWDKDVAPTPDLRKAFHGGDLDFDDFRDHYLRELSDSEAPQQLLDSAAHAEAKTIVLVYGAKDAEHNHAQVLADHLRALSKN